MSIVLLCNLAQSWKADIPVLYWLGGDDSVTPAEGCKESATHLTQKGRLVRSITYLEAGHLFDMAGGEAGRQAEQEVMIFLNTHLNTS